MTSERCTVKFLGSLIFAKTGDVRKFKSSAQYVTDPSVDISHGHADHRNTRALTTPNSFHTTKNNSDFESRLTDTERVHKVICNSALLTYLLTYLLTPWSRVLLEKLTGFAAIEEIPRIYATRKFIPVPTSARHLFLS
jgi:hypothetical protein